MSMAFWSIGWQAMLIPRVLLCPFTLQGPLALLALSGAAVCTPTMRQHVTAPHLTPLCRRPKTPHTTSLP